MNQGKRNRGKRQSPLKSGLFLGKTSAAAVHRAWGIHGGLHTEGGSAAAESVKSDSSSITAGRDQAFLQVRSEWGD